MRPLLCATVEAMARRRVTMYPAAEWDERWAPWCKAPYRRTCIDGMRGCVGVLSQRPRRRVAVTGAAISPDCNMTNWRVFVHCRPTRMLTGAGLMLREAAAGILCRDRSRRARMRSEWMRFRFELHCTRVSGYRHKAATGRSAQVAVSLSQVLGDGGHAWILQLCDGVSGDMCRVTHNFDPSRHTATRCGSVASQWPVNLFGRGLNTCVCVRLCLRCEFT